MPHLYVYYIVEKRHAAMLLERVANLQRQLGGRTDGRFFLRRRANPKARENETETWMEVYEDVASDFENQLDQAVRDSGLEEWIIGARHVERFD